MCVYLLVCAIILSCNAACRNIFATIGSGKRGRRHYARNDDRTQTGHIQRGALVTSHSGTVPDLVDSWLEAVTREQAPYTIKEYGLATTAKRLSSPPRRRPRAVLSRPSSPLMSPPESRPGRPVPPRTAALRLGDCPAAPPELDGELLGRHVAHQLFLRGQHRRWNSAEGTSVRLVAL